MIGTRAMVMPAMLWTGSMDVYITDPTTGNYTTLWLHALPCRLCETSRKDVAAAPMRAEGMEPRVLLFPPEYVIDSTAQVEILGHRYQIQSGTDQAARGPSGELVYRSYDVIHVDGDTRGPDLEDD